MKPDYWIRLTGAGVLVIPAGLVADGSGVRELVPGLVVGVLDDKLWRSEERCGSIERVHAPTKAAKGKE